MPRSPFQGTWATWATWAILDLAALRLLVPRQSPQVAHSLALHERSTMQVAGVLQVQASARVLPRVEGSAVARRSHPSIPAARENAAASRRSARLREGRRGRTPPAAKRTSWCRRQRVRVPVLCGGTNWYELVQAYRAPRSWTWRRRYYYHYPTRGQRRRRERSADRQPRWAT